VATFLSKQQILGATARQYAEVEVPELGGAVTVQSLTGAEYDDFQASCVVQNKDGSREANMRNFRARFVARVAVDPGTKERMFGVEDIAVLGRLPVAALNRVYDAAMKLNCLHEEAAGEAVKNS
jgi:hypothetical protein